MPEASEFKPTFLETVFGDRLLLKIESTEKARKKAQKEADDKDLVIETFKTVDIPAMTLKITQAERLGRYYKGLWAAGINIPNIRGLVKNHTLYDPWAGTGYDVGWSEIQDKQYYSYSLASWTRILDEIHREIEHGIPRFIDEVADCDNFADVMDAFVQLAFIDAGKQRQAAFGKASGRDGGSFHAYNFFVLPNRKIMIYEPQDGTIVGEFTETTGRYQTYKLQI